MNDEIMGFLYVTGELDRESSGVNDLIYKYNQRFPGYQIPESFYNLTIEEQLESLTNALDKGEPIPPDIQKKISW